MQALAQERILITGATGFVGRNLAAALHRRGLRTFGIGTRPSPDGVPCRYASVDLLDHRRLRAHLDRLRPTVVFHLGAHVVLERDYATARRTLAVNGTGTLNLLEALRPRAAALRRVVVLSTEEVYGTGPVPYREDQPVHPPSPYSVSKQAAESLALLYHRLYRLPTVVLRLATAYGPHQPAERFIPATIGRALRHQDIRMHSAGGRRDYVFIDDVVTALLAATRRRCAGEVINVGRPDSVPRKELVELILRSTGSRSQVRYGAAADRAGESSDWRSSMAKARRLLGWQPRTTLPAGLRRTVAWYRERLNVAEGADDRT